jgi:hypothetical protein
MVLGGNTMVYGLLNGIRDIYIRKDYIMALLYNRQHNEFVINNQYCCIVIRYIMYISYMFQSSWITIMQFFIKLTIIHWIVRISIYS